MSATVTAGSELHSLAVRGAPGAGFRRILEKQAASNAEISVFSLPYRSPPN